jgi:cell division protein FtsQ
MGARGLRSVSIPRPALPSGRAVRRWALALVLVGAALAAAYLLWFRDSSFVRVEAVRVDGAEGDPSIESALRSEGRRMSTLDVDEGALRAAVADIPAVESLSAEGVFPHRLDITVTLRRPAGYLEDDGAIEVVSGDGTILESADEKPEGLPPIDAPSDGGSEAVSGDALDVAEVLGAAPADLVGEIDEASLDSEHGVVAEVGDGIELRFGDTSRSPDKWEAAAAVLADPELVNATYIDVTVPEHPVAGTG